MSKILTEMPWVHFHLQDGWFAVRADHVQEMVVMPKVISLPQTPDYIRGVINLRGHTITVMDLRLRMGMPSLKKETEALIQLLNQREQDHKNWIAELESSVKERREFKLATDPHKCAFGEWYDTFETDNRILEGCLKKFDEPHQKIHAIAIKVKEMEGKEDFEGAYEIINKTKESELAEMVRLFSEVCSLLRESSREIAIVLAWEGKTMAISVDSVATVEKLNESNIEEIPDVITTKSNEFITGIGKHERNKEVVQLLNVGKLICNEAFMNEPPTRV